jgi:parallel beta-helix repeat protein
MRYWDGILFGNASDCSITDNYIFDNGQSGIYVGGNGTYATRIVISRNIVSYNWNRGVDLGLAVPRSTTNDVNNVVVSDNTSQNNRENNYWMAATSNVTVTGNRGIYDSKYNSWPGFAAYPGGQANFAMTDFSTDYPTGNTMSGNTVNGGLFGISFSSTGATGNTISGNTITGSPRATFYVPSGDLYVTNSVDIPHTETFNLTEVGGSQPAALGSGTVRLQGKRADYTMQLTMRREPSPSGNLILGTLPYGNSMSVKQSHWAVESAGSDSTSGTNSLVADFSNLGSGGNNQIKVGPPAGGTLDANTLKRLASGAAITIKGSVEF